MRSPLTVLLGGLVVWMLVSRMSVVRPLLEGVPWSQQIAALATAFAIGIVVGRGGWLVALAAYVLGIGLWVLVDLRPSPPWAPSDVWHLDSWVAFIVSMLPAGAIFALLAAAGSAVSRLTSARLRRTQRPPQTLTLYAAALLGFLSVPAVGLGLGILFDRLTGRRPIRLRVLAALLAVAGSAAILVLPLRTEDVQLPGRAERVEGS